MGKYSEKIKKIVVLLFALLNYVICDIGDGIIRENVMERLVIIKLKSKIRKEGKRFIELTGFRAIDLKLKKFKAVEIQEIFPNHRDKELNRIYLVRYTDNISPEIVAKELSYEPEVEYAEPKIIHTLAFEPSNDPKYVDGSQWALRKIQIEYVWQNLIVDSILIAIIDTGVDILHEDLKDNIWYNRREIPNNGIDDDNNGYIDDVVGWDFAGRDGFTPDNQPFPGHPHGTHVAGIVAASTNNGIGIAGVFPKSKVMVVKVSSDDPNDTRIIYGYEGIVYAVDNGARVINCSWGSYMPSKFGQDVINYAIRNGVIVVAAAGNKNSEIPFYPASYEGVISVAATDSLDRKAYFSNFGKRIDISAPGVNIISTFPGNRYAYLSGTSMASPHVAGVIAILLSQNLALTSEQVKQKIRITADKIDDLNPEFKYKLGYGRLNAYRALTLEMPAVKVEEINFVDENLNGVYEPGENINVTGILKNYLTRATSLYIEVVEISENALESLNRFIFIGGVETFQIKLFQFGFRVSNQVNENTRAHIVFKFSDQNYQYEDYYIVNLLINQTFLDHNTDSLVATITSQGNIGFNDYPNNTEGSGFLFQKIENLLFEGALIVGIDSIRVVDSARDHTGKNKVNDFNIVHRFTIKVPGSLAPQEGLCIFDDSRAADNKIGLRFKFETFAYDRYLIVKLTIRNISDLVFESIFAGMFFDWDIGSVYNNNLVFDSTYHMVYVYDSLKFSGSYAGVSLLYPREKINFFGIDNDYRTPGNPLPIWDGFTKKEKWKALSSGITRTQVKNTDVSFVISAGPFALLPNNEIIVSFAIFAASSLQGLKTLSSLANNKWSEILSGVGNKPPIFTKKMSNEITVNEGETLKFKFEAIDPDNDPIYFIPIKIPLNANLSTNGYFEWTPNYDDGGDHIINVGVTDGIYTVSSITIAHVNRKPKFVAFFSDTLIDEGEKLEYKFIAYDPDNDTVRYRLSSPVPNAKIDSSTGVFTWKPDFYQSGEYLFKVFVSDAHISDSVEFKIKVVNMGPLFPPKYGVVIDRPNDQGYYLKFYFVRSINDTLSSSYSPDSAKVEFYEILREGENSPESFFIFYPLGNSDTVVVDVPTYGDTTLRSYYIRSGNRRTYSSLIYVGSAKPVDNIPPEPIPLNSLRAYDDKSDNGTKIVLNFKLSPSDGKTWSDGKFVYPELIGYKVYKDNEFFTIIPPGDSIVSIDVGDRIKHFYSISAFDGVNESERSSPNFAIAIDNTLFCDFNADYEVNIFDLYLFALNFGTDFDTYPEFEALFDLNDDLKIDVQDLIIFSRNFGIKIVDKKWYKSHYPLDKCFFVYYIISWKRSWQINFFELYL